jgi:hypothetical protein
MFRFSRVLAVLISSFAWMTLPASAVEVMVVGNISPETGLNEVAAAKKLRTLMTKLYSYEGVNPIVYAANLSKAGLEPRLNEFEEKIADADFVIFYFMGLGAHDASGTSFLVPHGWSGKKSDLVALEDILVKMRAAANGKSLLIVDAVEPPQWKYESVYPGLGDIEREVRAGGVLIAYNHGEALPAKDGTQFTASFEKRLSEPLELRQLASLLQEDVSFETSGARVPRLAGTISASLQLNPASPEESTRKIKQVCSAANEQTPSKAAFVNGGSEAASPDAALTPAAAGDSESAVTVATAVVGERQVASSSPFSWFFCPGGIEPEPEEQVRPARPTVRRAPRHDRPAVAARSSERPVAARRYREPQAAARSYAYHSGGSAPAEVRAAVPGG